VLLSHLLVYFSSLVFFVISRTLGEKQTATRTITRTRPRTATTETAAAKGHQVTQDSFEEDSLKVGWLEN